jgi:hypothetical protein
MKLFRERLLARLVERHAISDELARKLVAWTHPGFSSHTELEIQRLHAKLDELRQRDWAAIVQMQREQIVMLAEVVRKLSAPKGD